MFIVCPGMKEQAYLAQGTVRENTGAAATTAAAKPAVSAVVYRLANQRILEALALFIVLGSFVSSYAWTALQQHVIDFLFGFRPVLLFFSRNEPGTLRLVVGGQLDQFLAQFIADYQVAQTPRGPP